MKAFALNAATGEQLWEFDPHKSFEFGTSVNRGLMYWESGEESRLFYSAGVYLLAINPKTGELINGFGEGSKVSLRKGIRL